MTYKQAKRKESRANSQRRKKGFKQTRGKDLGWAMRDTKPGIEHVLKRNTLK